ncbi:hypothetical protein QQP08_009517 [Theobroma cacao]|nr:hypothetical protein QQP08_009517 [Theobroma cacao]
MLMTLRVARARMSAHETMPGQESSIAVFARTMTSKASPGRDRLMSASRSALLKELEEIRTEASQPPTMQSWKKRRRVAAAVSVESLDSEKGMERRRKRGMRKRKEGKAMVRRETKAFPAFLFLRGFFPYGKEERQRKRKEARG